MRNFTIILIATLLLCVGVSAVETVPNLSIGTVLQSGTPSQRGIAASLDIILSKPDSSTYMVKLSESYLYSEKVVGGTVFESQVLRSFVVGTKELGLWGMFLGLGTGSWTFLNTGGEDKTYNAYRFEGGIKIKEDFHFLLGSDVVIIPGAADVYFPNAALIIGF